MKSIMFIQTFFLTKFNNYTIKLLQGNRFILSLYQRQRKGIHYPEPVYHYSIPREQNLNQQKKRKGLILYAFYIFLSSRSKTDRKMLLSYLLAFLYIRYHTGL